MTSFAILLSQQSELRAQALELDQQIEQARREELKAVVTQIRNLMSSNGLSLEDLGLDGLKTSKRARKTSAASGRKVAAKYRSSTGQEWSGRGLKPKWLKAELAAGKTVESFLIKA